MKKSKTAFVKEALLNGATVTSMFAFKRWYATRLSDIIFRLRRKYDLPIVTGTPDSAFCDGLISDSVRKQMMLDYDTSHFAVYYIKPCDLKNLQP